MKTKSTETTNQVNKEGHISSKLVIANFRKLNPKGLPTAVALSGGLDSVALLHCLSCLQRRVNIFACHFIHDMRSKEESMNDCKVAEEAAKKCGIPFLSRNIADYKDNPIYSKVKNGEQRARDLRYLALSEMIDEYLGDKNKKSFIATAHHADDQLETLIMRLCRGSGINGMVGIESSISFHENKTIIRPMLCITKEDAKNICLKNSLKWAEDHTNQDESYSRNRIRSQVIPLLKDIYPFASRNAVGLSDICSSAEINIKKQAKECVRSLHELKNRKKETYYAIQTHLLSSQDKVVFYEIVMHICKLFCNDGKKIGKIKKRMFDSLYDFLQETVSTRGRRKNFTWPIMKIEANSSQDVIFRKNYGEPFFDNRKNKTVKAVDGLQKSLEG